MPDFTQRHYEAIANVLAAERKATWEDGEAKGYYPGHKCDAIAATATRLADLFERDNPNFNRVRFFLAADCEDQK